MQVAAVSRLQPYVRNAGCSQFSKVIIRTCWAADTCCTHVAKQRSQLETEKPKRNSLCDCARPLQCERSLRVGVMLKRLSCERENFPDVEPSVQYEMMSLSSTAFGSGAGTCPQSTRCSVLSQRPVQGLLCQRSSKHLNSCHSSFRTFAGANASKTRRRTTSTPATNATDLPLVNAGWAPFCFPVVRMISCAHWLINITQ